jgi:hypothetical protein
MHLARNQSAATAASAERLGQQNTVCLENPSDVHDGRIGAKKLPPNRWRKRAGKQLATEESESFREEAEVGGSYAPRSSSNWRALTIRVVLYGFLKCFVFSVTM